MKQKKIRRNAAGPVITGAVAWVLSFLLVLLTVLGVVACTVCNSPRFARPSCLSKRYITSPRNNQKNRADSARPVSSYRIPNPLVLHNSLCSHGIYYFFKACNIGADHIISIRMITLCSIIHIVENIYHNVL